MPRASARPPVRPSARPPVRPSARPPVRPSVRPSVRPPVRPSVRPSARPPVRPPVRPSARPSNNKKQLSTKDCRVGKNKLWYPIESALFEFSKESGLSSELEISLRRFEFV